MNGWNVIFSAIPRKKNLQAHSLATFASTCNLPFQPNHKYNVEVKHRPIIPDNLKYWKIFSQDQNIYHFMNNEDEFHNCKIDTDCTLDQDLDSEIGLNNFDVNKVKFARPTKFSQSDIDNLERVEIDEIIYDESEILNLKDNFFPKGLTPLEDLFDSNDVARKPKMEPLRSDIENAT